MMSTIVTPAQLAQIEKNFRELVTGPFNFRELVTVIDDMLSVIKSVQGLNAEEAVEQAQMLFDALDTQFDVIEIIDGWLKLPLWAEPLDSIALRYVIKSVIIPLGINQLWSL